MGNSTAERIERLQDLARILSLEIAASKVAQTALTSSLVSARDEVRAMEVNVTHLEHQLAGLREDAWEDDNERKQEIVVIDRVKRRVSEQFKNDKTKVCKLQVELDAVDERIQHQQHQLAVISEETSQLLCGGRPSGLYPWPMLYPQLSDNNVEAVVLSVTTCALCSFAFPNSDIVIASCKHAYHPWCAFAVFSYGIRCALQSCQAQAHPTWHQSFGWAIQSEELQHEAANVNMDGELRVLLQVREENAKQHQAALGILSPCFQFMDLFAGSFVYLGCF